MKNKISRRNFLIKSSVAGAACCTLMTGSGLSAMNNYLLQNNDDEILDLKKLNYCGYKCPADCQFLKGTLNNDEELKKEAYKLWKIKERFDIEFDPETIFCYGCKVSDKPEGVVTKNCTVRECAMSKKIDCCIECDELTSCDKDLWSRFPKFKESVIEMQKKYLEQKE
jgi:hypothetical protein